MDPSMVPLAPKPDGSPPNFMSGPSLAPVNVSIGSIIIALSVIIVTLRLYASYKNIGRLSLDDCFCLGSEITVLVYWGLLTANLERGIGRHAWDLPVSVVSPWVLKRHVVSQFFGATGNWLSKASILAFFIRVFGSVRWVRIACYALFVLLSMGAITHAGLFAVLCVPHGHEVWNFKLMIRCGTGAPVTVAVGVCTLLIDIAIFILPFPIIANLNMDKNKKRGLFIVFLIGFAIIVTSTVGLAYRIIVLNSTGDPTWNGANVSITAYVDTFGTIIVSCAPGVYSWWLKIFSQSRLYSSLRSMSLLRPRNFSVTSRDYVLKERENSPEWNHQEQCQYKLPEIVTSSPQEKAHEGTQGYERNIIPVSTVITQTISDRVESYKDIHQMQEYPWQSTDTRNNSTK
ncbi:uncharacterized protein TrAFT101_005486 [Trichoderma asperellum]|uniref:Rhodopsin domain-containing protein n=2 Tax=Trichoderma asperellum TaxID=101201 RepID=A0A2T3YYK9_TRIA4|nr:hypothetical protein M441DRAFT_60814 [Trichoderma asperellum CBS 433.97]PTB37636.1 hypothetical protein M441DRAFT_60814 [Trichoderma asperellum CBS 433.97]UKZ90471.1 hypothetical protein TrAFT101_005486 [Trichoderma asperellum]